MYEQFIIVHNIAMPTLRGSVTRLIGIFLILLNQNVTYAAESVCAVPYTAESVCAVTYSADLSLTGFES